MPETPDDFELLTDERGRLVLRRPGHDDAVGVRIRRAFPWSGPGRHISIRSAEGGELLLVNDLATATPAQRKSLEAALADTSFIPRITRVQAIDTRFDHQDWSVQTDRGPARFRVQEREDVRFLDDGRFRVKDADGNVYEMPPLDTLDEHTRRQIEKLL